jgi:dTDP-4-amino-4,6-dideoxygalactose transaminase
MRQVRDHGRSDKYTHPIFGLNLRMDEIQAAIVRVQMRLLERRTERRRKNAARLTEALRGTGLVLPAELPDSQHVYHLYVVRTPRRDELAVWLSQRGIASGIHYPIPCHLQEACTSYGFREGSLPATEAAAREVLSLPIYPELSDEDLKHIIEGVRSFCRTDSALPATSHA